MCGLIGIVVGKKYKRDELEKVKSLFTQVLIEHEERGKEATGVAAVWPDSSYILKKAPIAASTFVQSKGYLEFLKKIDSNVSIILGHTRKPTKGDLWNMDNNHPIIAGDIVGVHNGTIKNDDHLFSSEKLTRQAEVDSEIIFSILNEIKFDEHSESFAHSIQDATKKLTGSFTTLSVNLKYPEKILLLKYNQPMSYHYSKSLETLFFTSKYLFLRKAFGRSVITEALPSRTGYMFNLSSNSVPRGEPCMKFPIDSGNGS
ncbi:MAG: hypothetical protein ABFR75_09665 [Acidobacteriota bacterium]